MFNVYILNKNLPKGGLLFFWSVKPLTLHKQEFLAIRGLKI